MSSEDKKLYKEKAQQQQSEPSGYRSKVLLKKVGKMVCRLLLFNLFSLYCFLI